LKLQLAPRLPEQGRMPRKQGPLPKSEEFLFHECCQAMLQMENQKYLRPGFS
jgi:hypothetical protein